ncbi:MAG TPA: NAD(P)H-binding protein [Puia sp.]|nr:NAD(P)H-binding protein [Puia sp.]
MNFIVTGSLGHISRPLVEKLVNGGHSVTVISRNQSKQREIELLGAKAAIGTMEDTEFLTKEFTGADAVYSMEAPGNFFNPDYDLHEAHRRIGNNYFQAIGRSGVKRVVHLSSIGAHTDKGNGILSYHHEIESILNQLPADVSITFMRPVGFYYNLLAFINVIKKLGVIVSNYGEDDIIPWVSPKDVADAVADELTKPGSGRKIR